MVPPLEGFWWMEGKDGIDYARKEDLHWISVIRLPDFMIESDFSWAVSEATKKKKQDFSKVEFLTVEEEHCGWVAQHLGIIEKLGYDNYLLEMTDI